MPMKTEVPIALGVAAAAMLWPFESARAQDIPGIEICTRESQPDRRIGCLQSNVEYLQQVIVRNAATANREIAALKEAAATASREFAAHRDVIAVAGREVAANRDAAAGVAREVAALRDQVAASSHDIAALKEMLAAAQAKIGELQRARSEGRSGR